MTTTINRNLVREDNQDPKNDKLFKVLFEYDYNGNINADCFNLQIIASIYNVNIGRGGSHIWVSEKETNKRIMVIYY